VDWDPAAVRLAVRLLELPDEKVRTALHRRWDELTTASAVPADLWRALSLPEPPGEPPSPPGGDPCP